MVNNIAFIQTNDYTNIVMRLYVCATGLDFKAVGNQDREKVIKELLDRFSLVDASILVKNYLYDKTDYITLKDEIFSDESIEDLYDNI